MNVGICKLCLNVVTTTRNILGLNLHKHISQHPISSQNGRYLERNSKILRQKYFAINEKNLVIADLFLFFENPIQIRYWSKLGIFYNRVPLGLFD